MKRIISLLLVASMGTAIMCGCSSEKPAETVSVETEAETDQSVSSVQADTSEWEMNSDRQNLFDAATEALDVEYVPIICLGVPESDPLGTSFLCRSSVVSPDAEANWVIVTVRDVGSSVTVEQVKYPSFAHSSTAETMYLEDEPDELLVGGWFPVQDMTLTGDALDAYNEVTAGELDGAVPCGVLATQEVYGTNYCILVNDGGRWKCAYISVTSAGNFLLNIAELVL